MCVLEERVLGCLGRIRHGCGWNACKTEEGQGEGEVCTKGLQPPNQGTEETQRVKPWAMRFSKRQGAANAQTHHLTLACTEKPSTKHGGRELHKRCDANKENTQTQKNTNRCFFPFFFLGLYVFSHLFPRTVGVKTGETRGTQLSA